MQTQDEAELGSNRPRQVSIGWVAVVVVVVLVAVTAGRFVMRLGDVAGLVIAAAAALVLDGRPSNGSGGAAGEIGHVVVQPGGALCSCGRRANCVGSRPHSATMPE